MEENQKNMESTAESVEKVETTQVQETKKEEEKTYTRDEVNKMINAEKLKERQAVITEYENKKAEADKLAKMDEDQKLNYQLKEANKRADEAERKLNAMNLQAETIKQANAKGIPLELVQTLDFEKETAESISSKLEIFEKTSKSVREKAISEYSKEEPPQTGDKVDNTKPESQMTYEELSKLPKYKN